RSRGTIVLPRAFEEKLRTLAPFTEEVKRKGRAPRAKMIEFAQQQANNEDVSLLNLRNKAQIYHVHRVRFIDDEPVGDIISHIPVALLPHLKADDFSEHGPNQSMYYVLEKVHGIKLVRATETFKAINSSPDTAKLLNMPVGSAVLMRTRVTFDTANRAVALEYGLYRGVYRLEWEGREVSVDTSTLL
ncbi:MAG: GntR family transcriptional regulator, partial [Anaerolineae bacterium]|nr:GntR family transcriptional regulator [Anaerolineae bacterium]